MQVNVNKLSPVLVEFDVQVEADRVRSEFDKAFSETAKGAKVRGFRPGRAPRQVVMHMYGARIAADVAKRLVDETFPEVATQNAVQPVGAPAVEQQKLVRDRPFSYKARVEILPEVTEVNYERLAAKRPKTEATEQQVQEELDRVRRELSTLEPLPEPRGARLGDVLTVDLLVEVAGKPVPEVTARDFQAELGLGGLLPGIEDALLDKNVGDQPEAEVQLPPNHPAPRLRGQKATFKMSIKDIKQRVLPELDDELAKDAGEYATLEELRQSLKERVEQRLKEQADNAVAEQLVLELVKANPIPIPNALVEQQMRLTEREVLDQARAAGQQTGKGLGEELRARIRADSEVKVRAGLLMAAIAKAEGIRIGKEQIEAGLRELAEQTGKNIAKLRVEYRDRHKHEMLVGMILENKVLDIIEAKAQIEAA
jgi:trigger factor